MDNKNLWIKGKYWKQDLVFLECRGHRLKIRLDKKLENVDYFNSLKIFLVSFETSSPTCRPHLLWKNNQKEK